MIDELIALVGEEAFIKLAIVFGGSKQYIGETQASEARLTVVMGAEAARKMIQTYSGGWINIPKHTQAEITLRNKHIIQDAYSGNS
jgi:hypothetical protein